jgi:hypothetical protein
LSGHIDWLLFSPENGSVASFLFMLLHSHCRLHFTWKVIFQIISNFLTIIFTIMILGEIVTYYDQHTSVDIWSIVKT